MSPLAPGGAVPDLARVAALFPSRSGWPGGLALLATTWLLLLGATRLCATLYGRRLDAALAWTELARQVHRVRVARALVRLVLLGGFWTATPAVAGALSPWSWPGLAALVVLLVLVTGSWLDARFEQRWQRVALPAARMSWSDWPRNALFRVVLLWPPLLIAGAIVALGPARFDWRFGLVWSAGIGAMVWLARGGSASLARRLGLLRRAPPRLVEIVERASRRCGVPVRDVWVVPLIGANALAFSTRAGIGFTPRALDALDEAQLEAIALHELGHLAESRGRARVRLLALGFFAVIAAARPIHAQLGWAGLLVAVGAALLSARVLTGFVRRRELDADAHAVEHGDDAVVYASALERLHRVNLVPAVLGRSRGTHPELFDRLTSAGVTPAYERPAPPARAWRAAVPIALLALALWAVHDRAAALRGDPQRAVLWFGGDARSFAALAIGARDARPLDAEALLAAAVELAPRWPGHRIDHAEVLMDLGRLDAAAGELDDAEARVAELGELMPWLRGALAAARERLSRAR